MSLIQAIILGIVQGLGEFLPISSSGHLALVPWLFNFHTTLTKSQELAFDVALHLGTAVAVLAFFRNDFAKLLKAFIGSVKAKKAETLEAKFGWYLVIGSIPGAIAGVLLEKKAETIFRSPLLIAGALAAMGVILLAADRLGRKTKDINKVTFKDALIIGTMQAFALIPGVSRAGITMTAGLLRGFDRPAAARFSFLLSAPVTIGAALYESRKLIHMQLDAAFLVGILTSAIVGYLSINYLLKYLQSKSFAVFAVYRFLVAAAVIAVIVLGVRSIGV